MYTRQKRYSSESAFVPSAPTPEVRVPINYSGVAFDRGFVRQERPDPIEDIPHGEEPPPLSTPSAASCFPDADPEPQEASPCESETPSRPEAPSRSDTGFDSEDLLIIGIALLLLNGDLSSDAIWLLMLLLF